MNDRFNRYIQAFLAVAITAGFFSTIGVLFYINDLPTGVKDILLVLLGALLASWKEVTGYFFGSSSGSARKDEQNAALTAQLAPNPATPQAVQVTNSEPVPVVETPPAR